MICLDDLANTRTGDKGDTLILGVFPHNTTAFHHLVHYLNCSTVAIHFGVSEHVVTREIIDSVESMVFKIEGILGGGVTGSPVLDGHGKTLSYHALGIPLPTLA
ncbi:hypothetical protein N24_2388 [Corynebacterium suranareeae]|uniref:AtuA-like ferredoxin-fold domain-containing protein n=1 Tax=Corynebacterium suranareeae TaxID=2506452 RepID=A0A160PVB7_9CORY|nr:hypothetical protein [Corynebacterium suranareeae]BAU96650.1 hypothetical protein N24_2388 [Corynebacterium suranareeae]